VFTVSLFIVGVLCLAGHILRFADHCSTLCAVHFATFTVRLSHAPVRYQRSLFRFSMFAACSLLKDSLDIIRHCSMFITRCLLFAVHIPLFAISVHYFAVYSSLFYILLLAGVSSGSTVLSNPVEKVSLYA
jgi:hypothetical protein